jgi:hypothetical protein
MLQSALTSQFGELYGICDKTNVVLPLLPL